MAFATERPYLLYQNPKHLCHVRNPNLLGFAVPQVFFHPFLFRGADTVPLFASKEVLCYD